MTQDAADPDIQVEDARPLPPGAPADFRMHLALALKTTDIDVLEAAEEGYRGIFLSADEYISNQIAEHLPPFLGWILACCDPKLLRERYEAGKIAVWTIRLPDGRVMVFEAVREPPGRL